MTARLLVSVLLVAGACTSTDQERTELTCTVFCGCEAPPLPALQDQCMAQCRQDIDASRFSDECLACISGNADRCATIEQQCGPICQPPQPDPFFDEGVP